MDIFKDMLDNDIQVEVDTVKFQIGKNPMGKWNIVFVDFSAGFHKDFNTKNDAIEFLEDLFGSRVVITKEFG